MFPHHKPIVTVEKELTMICRLCNGAVSETQLISVPVTLTDDVHFPPARKPQIRHVKIRLSSGLILGMLSQSRRETTVEDIDSNHP